MFFYFLYNYSELFSLVLFLFGFCLILFGLTILFSETNNISGKWIAYESGLDPFSDAREPYSIKFFIVALTYLLFDVELIFFIPLVFYVTNISFVGLFFFFCFLLDIFSWILL
jgi:NADH-quinone oxidoreductase subunit A